MVADDFFRFFGRLFLGREKSRAFGETLRSAGRTSDPEVFAGLYIIGAFVIGALLSLFLNWLPGFFPSFYWFLQDIVVLQPIYIFVILFLLCEILSYISLWVLAYITLTLSIETRTKSVEAVLPDFLMYVSSNVKAGMPLDQAIWYAAKPEFGLLSIEVKTVMKQSFGSQTLETSLDELSKVFKSDIFNRTLLLLRQAIASGAEVAEVLDRTAEDARESLLLRKEIEASLVLYEIFVLFASMVGTPFLFAVSTKLIAILEKAFAKLPPTSFQTQQFIGMIKPAVAPIVTSSQFFWFTMGVLLVTSLFSSFILGVIRTGSRTQGFKYFPVILLISAIIYYLVIGLLDMFFTNVLL
ncbi:MAG: type II secretion system F family protein [Candidatus ainarchaeum sp.]|nr:type II secretion system F family protein [Candidatus ainarchaeum sp.]